MRLLTYAQENLKEMHPNRVKKITSQVPYMLSHLTGPATKLLPRKLSSRISIHGSMKKLHEDIQLNKLNPQMTANEWALERSAIYQETLLKLSLND